MYLHKTLNILENNLRAGTVELFKSFMLQVISPNVFPGRMTKLHIIQKTSEFTFVYFNRFQLFHLNSQNENRFSVA